MYKRLSVRVKSIIVGVLLLLALGLTVYCAVTTVQGFESFQQQKALVAAGDVRSIGPWMTIPYISHTYHVPESYLYQTLNINDAKPLHHATLRVLAAGYHLPINDLIHRVQAAIQTYRQQHLHNHSYAHRSRSPGGIQL